MGTTVQGVGKGGHGLPDTRNNLRGSGPGGPAVWVGDMGDENLHWDGVGRIPPQGGPQADGTETSEGEGCEVVVSSTDRSNVGGGVTGGGDPRLPPTEHSHTVHRDQTHYGNVSGGREASWVTGVQSVVGSGRFGLGGDADGVLGGGTGGEGGGDGCYDNGDGRII